MKRSRRLFYAVIGFLLIGSVSLLLFQEYRRTETEPEPEPVNYSVVLYGRLERWMSLNAGMRQACLELGWANPDINLIDQYSNSDEQRKLLAAKLSANRGLITAAADYTMMDEFLQDDAGTTPVILVESGTLKRSAIAADDRAMGARLFEEITKTFPKQIVLISSVGRRLSTDERKEGFLERARETGYAVIERSSPGLLGAGDAVAALDCETLEAVVDSGASGRIYGIGYSDRVVAALDRGTIAGVVCDNEFKIGYIAMIKLAQALGMKTAQILSEEITIQYVDRENLYDPEIQYWVFPVLT